MIVAGLKQETRELSRYLFISIIIYSPPEEQKSQYT